MMRNVQLRSEPSKEAVRLGDALEAAFAEGLAFMLCCATAFERDRWTLVGTQRLRIKYIFPGIITSCMHPQSSLGAQLAEADLSQLRAVEFLEHHAPAGGSHDGSGPPAAAVRFVDQRDGVAVVQRAQPGQAGFDVVLNLPTADQGHVVFLIETHGSWKRTAEHELSEFKRKYRLAKEAWTSAGTHSGVTGVFLYVCTSDDDQDLLKQEVEQWPDESVVPAVLRKSEVRRFLGPFEKLLYPAAITEV
eukprot:TRINITY_DN31108_c0_g1_i2.p2 TRINITY_DN31108_c0_g1~~TRINITY_DN31108_c0_g1_i2.p2  ORF type:complete len:247 (+),score=40.81 TRINITY_DN31108_c0_g1_i2:1321-2061(+)